MYIKSILEDSKGSPQTEPMAFRLPADDKAKVLAICEKERLSVGKLMRNLVADFINEYEANK